MKRPLVFAFSLLSLGRTTFAAEAKAEAESAPAAAIEGTVAVSAGGAWIDGDKAAFERRFQHDADVFGGIEQLRYRRETDQSSLTLDGRLMPGDESYGLHGRWMLGETLYLDAGYDQYRVFYDGSGRYFPTNGAYFSLFDERLHVDRSKLWFEVGLTPENKPHLRLRYERQTRDGSKPTTELGETNLTGGLGSKSIVPGTLELDETRDTVTLDVTSEHAGTRWGAGARYEHSEYANARKNIRRPTEAAATRAVTTRESVETDLFSGHGYYEKKFGDKLTTSVGAMTATLDTNLGGSRLYGADYDPVFDPVFPRRQIGDLGFLNLGGGTQMKQYVFNGTAVYRPHKHWMIRPAVRYEHLQFDNVSTFIATNVLNNLTTALTNSAAESQKDENKLTETVEVRYTGRPSWVYSARGEWYQTSGDLTENLRNADTGATALARDTDYRRQSQKYTLAAQWYARAGLTFTGEYYYKLRLNDYNPTVDSTPPTGFDRYPAFIANQDFTTHDLNVRVSWRPTTQLSLVTRYDLQRSQVMSSFEAIPKSRSSRTTTHILSQSATYTPIARLYLTGSLNVAFDQLATPAAGYIRNSDNNYVNASLSAGYALSKTTDLYFDATRYQARDYSDNSRVSLPYGADVRTDTASLTCVIRRNAHLVYTLRYTYAQNDDRASGGYNDYRAHFVYSKVQYSF